MRPSVITVTTRQGMNFPLACSALSGELSRMQREGLLTVERNRFVLQDGHDL